MKLHKLRELMKLECIDAYIITKFDPHQSEYVSDYWNGVKFISGFSGSSGTVVVTQDKAGLWTDGRYYIQAEKELTDGISLYKASEPDTINPEDFCIESVEEDGIIAFDARTMPADKGIFLSNKRTLKTDTDLLSLIWENRGNPYGKAPIFEHDIRFCGKTRAEKLTDLRDGLKREEIYAISSLDDIAWLFNLRGGDIENSVVFYAFALISKESAYLYAEAEKLWEVRKELESEGVIIKSYEEIYTDLSEIKDKTLLINPAKSCYKLYKSLKPKLIKSVQDDLTALPKAVKNEVEIKNAKNAFVKDGVAMVKFIKWLKENAGRITERDAEEKLLELRSEMELFLCPSFATIAAYMQNAAIVHYAADRENPALIYKMGMFLIDSGGHYLDGTTDITRTVVLGETDENMRRDFTFVLKSHIALATAVFPYGATGTSLDAIARAPMWENYRNFNHGIGHGIGFCLNVHEGPQRLSMASNNIKLESGMLLSNEPGIYIEGKYGIRTENIMTVEEVMKNDFGRFMKFSTLSLCPIDINGIEISMITEKEKKWLNEYHNEVYAKLSPFLSAEEKAFLAEETRTI